MNGVGAGPSDNRQTSYLNPNNIGSQAYKEMQGSVVSQGSQGAPFARQMWQNQAMRSSSRAGSRAGRGGGAGADNNQN